MDVELVEGPYAGTPFLETRVAWAATTNIAVSSLVCNKQECDSSGREPGIQILKGGAQLADEVCDAKGADCVGSHLRAQNSG